MDMKKAKDLINSIADQLENGFVACNRCGDQEDTASLDVMDEVRQLRSMLNNAAPAGTKLVPMVMNDAMAQACIDAEIKYNRDMGEPAPFIELWDAVIKAAPDYLEDMHSEYPVAIDALEMVRHMQWIKERIEANQDIPDQDYSRFFGQVAELLNRHPERRSQLEWSLEEDDVQSILDFAGDSGDVSPLTLRVGWIEAASGKYSYGLLCSLTEYPDEGAILLREMPKPMEGLHDHSTKH